MNVKDPKLLRRPISATLSPEAIAKLDEIQSRLNLSSRARALEYVIMNAGGSSNGRRRKRNKKAKRGRS